jgi:hypothetical protein
MIREESAVAYLNGRKCFPGALLNGQMATVI